MMMKMMIIICIVVTIVALMTTMMYYCRHPATAVFVCGVRTCVTLRLSGYRFCYCYSINVGRSDR